MSPALKTDLAAAAARLRQSTVIVQGRGPGAGSGVIWGPRLVVTNAHVARDARARLTLSDGNELQAEVIARDPRRDLAALAVDEDLTVAPQGDSGALRVGELVMAVGNPLGIAGAAALGIVHERTRDWVRADVRLAPGNSGGPLANARGEVVGINSMIAGGLALAVPSRAVRRFLQPPRRIGVTLRSIGAGLLVLAVDAGGPASRAGLLAGDLLVDFHDPDDLAAALRGPTVNLNIVRAGARIQRLVRLDGAAAA